MCLEGTCNIKGSVRSISSFQHPLQKRMDFVFSDFEPNRNGQGIPTTELENLISTGKNMPIKLVLNNNEKVHYGSIPIGPISHLEKGTFEGRDAIIGHALLWSEEYPDAVNYIQSKLDAEEGIYFSWEVYYKNAEKIGEVSWLQDCVVAAATIVDDPAYSKRTPLISFSEFVKNGDNVMDEKTVKELEAAQAEVQKKEQFITELQKRVEGLEKAVATSTGEAETLRQTVTEQTAELQELRQYKTRAEAERLAAELRTNRKAAIEQAGVEYDFESNADKVLGMNEDAFHGWLSAMSEMSKKSQVRQTFPEPFLKDGEDDELDRDSLVQLFKKSL